ncbi:hypothetical protein NESM_000758500 [Novymonas esmeraldas]|uniref:Uncharacterized protein n=1 Tax=Novymonas esmeraldas TaxID=1808958 RepID=A0AAW0EYQ6_9TRYP
MAQLQTQVGACIDDVEESLASVNGCLDHSTLYKVNAAYDRFLRYAWYELPVSSTDGAALSTVSCMPVWELLNQRTGLRGASRTPATALAVQVFTSMYAKSKDRRCMFQQLSCFGGGSQPVVPLSAPVPIHLPAPAASSVEPVPDYIRTAKRVLKLAAVGGFTEGKDTAAIASAVRSFVNIILPKCTLVSHAKELAKQPRGEVYILWSNPTCDWHSGSVFLLTLWCILMAAEYLALPESKELSNFLRSSRWSARLVEVDGRRQSYGELLSPFVDICAACVAANPRSSSTSVDNVPLIDPRVIPLLLGDGRSGEQRETGKRFSEEYTACSMLESKTTLTERYAHRLKELLSETIPGEVDFMGTSSSCRDFDQLAYLCRDCVFTFSQPGASRGRAARMRRDMLFSRKRMRGSSDSDGPCFVPVQSVVSDMLEKRDSRELVTLERLCEKWKNDAE